MEDIVKSFKKLGINHAIVMVNQENYDKAKASLADIKTNHELWSRSIDVPLGRFSVDMYGITVSFRNLMHKKLP